MKKSKNIERLGGFTNAVVVQLPERHKPGVIIQKDSIENLLNLVRDAQNQMTKNDWDELRGLLDELGELIDGYVSAFDVK